MIQDVEGFRSKLYGLALPDYESPVQRAIHDGVAGAWQNVTACITESVRRGRRERIDVEELIDAALAGGKVHAHSGNHVRTVGCPGVSVICRVVNRVEGCSVLEGKVAAELPIPEYRPPNRRRWNGIHVAARQSAPHVEE